MRAVVVEKQRGRSKSAKARRAYVCFLEREVYAFLSTFDKRGERVRGAMLRARIFCLWEGRKSWWWMGRGRHARTVGRATRKERRVRAVREKGKKGSFLFLEEKIRRYLLYLLDGDSSRSVSTAALGNRRRRGKRRVRGPRHEVENPACGGLRPPDPAYPAYIP